jgi:hypothetical protein
MDMTSLFLELGGRSDNPTVRIKDQNNVIVVQKYMKLYSRKDHTFLKKYVLR